MKTLFLLLIIYSLHYVALSHDTFTITYKNYPKKVHPDTEHLKLVNAGSFYKKYHKSKPFTRFEPAPVPEWVNIGNNQKHLAPPERDSFPLDFPAHIQSRVKKVPYFNDKASMRSKRAANESNAEVTTKETTSVKPTETSETTKLKIIESTVAVSPKNASISRRSAPNNAKAPAKTAKKRPVPQKVSRLSDSKAVRSRSVKRQGVKKNVNPKRFLRKRKAKSSVARAGKSQAKNVKGAKQAGKPPGRQASKSSGRQASKVPARQASKLSGRQGSKQASKQASKQVNKQTEKKPSKKPAAKHIARSKSHQKARRPVASRRLISARDARPEDYPYMLSIQKDNQHWCSGAIINPQLIVSTANCFWKSKAISRMKIRAGARSIDTGGQVAYIAEVRKHPNWSIRKDPANDIALALLDRQLKFSNAVHGLDLPNIFMKPPFDDAWVTSYGAERRDGVFSRIRLTLQVTYMRLMSDEKCNNVTTRFGVLLDDSFFCMEQVGRRAPCTRDTGAPAVSDGVLWGLASWGIRKLCGTERFPAMFTDVSEMSNMDFIVNATKDMLSDQRLSPFLDRLPVHSRAGGSLSIAQVPNKTPGPT